MGGRGAGGGKGVQPNLNCAPRLLNLLIIGVTRSSSAPQREVESASSRVGENNESGMHGARGGSSRGLEVLFIEGRRGYLRKQ